MSYDSPPPFAAVFAEVEVDIETGLVRVLKVVEAVDCGQVVNPQMAEGQVEGAAVQAIGYGLYERMPFDADGRMAFRSFRDYTIATASDVPELVTILVPTHEPTGPFGAKAIAEIPINGPAPAIANAVFHATGAAPALAAADARPRVVGADGARPGGLAPSTAPASSPPSARTRPRTPRSRPTGSAGARSRRPRAGRCRGSRSANR